ncbi:MAG: hotdog fold thioesterase [Bacteroidaceae bacterium]|nr:hotdog fold thioesterase [Bacteroidaceae bacterium]
MTTLIDKLNQGDRFASGIGAQLKEIREGYARAELTVQERHLNGAGVCQGGVMYTLADLAFAAVANSRGILSLGISNTITMLKSAQQGDVLTAECTEVLNHHRLPYCDIRITNQNGDIMATMTGLAYRTKRDFPFDSLM